MCRMAVHMMQRRWIIPIFITCCERVRVLPFVLDQWICGWFPMVLAIWQGSFEFNGLFGLRSAFCWKVCGVWWNQPFESINSILRAQLSTILSNRCYLIWSSLPRKTSVICYVNGVRVLATSTGIWYLCSRVLYIRLY